MKLVRKTEEYSIYQRGDQRYAVRDADKRPVNGDEKVRILVEEDLIKAAVPAAKPAETAAADEEKVAAEAESTGDESTGDEAAEAEGE